MNPWKSFPLIRLLIPFLGGVICALAYPGRLPDPQWLVGIACLLSGSLLFITLVRTPAFHNRWIPGIAIFLLMTCLGMLTTQTSTSLNTGNARIRRYFTGLPGKEDTMSLTEGMHPGADRGEQRYAKNRTFIAEIIEPPRYTSKSVKLVARCYALDSVNPYMVNMGKSLLYMQKDTHSMALQYGDQVIISSTLKPVRKASNPYGFDPADYYGRKGVFSQGWVESSAWRRCPVQHQNSLRRLAFSVRDRLLQIMIDNQLEREEFSVAGAILLGYTAEIDQDLRKGFAASGAMHILAVSGMHVGIIFLFLETILSFLDKRAHGPKVKSAIIILMIWSYAMITGLSPPVLRAALMLSMVILGRMFTRKPDSLNVVGGSMLVILLIDPSLLLNIGFQFSYLAVFGILFLYRPIHGLIPVTGWLLSRVWGLAAVSVAAQLATFPLSLFAFHQFPNYFILTNLMILPLTSLVIYLGIGVLALSPFPAVSVILAVGLSFVVGLMNRIVRLIEDIPGSVTTGMYPTMVDTILLYLVIVAVCCFLITLNKHWAFLVLITLGFWSGCSLYEDYKMHTRQTVVVFQVSGASQYGFVSGRRLVCLKDYGAACKTAYAQELICTFTEAEGIRESFVTYLVHGKSGYAGISRDFGPLAREGDFLQFHKTRIAVVSSSFPENPGESYKADVVIIRMSPDITMERMIQLFHPRCIVVDPTNSRSRTRKWREQAESAGVTCHVVAEDGAFTFDARSLD